MNLDMTLTQPFDLPVESVASLPRPLLPLARLWLSRVLAFDRLNDVYAAAVCMPGRFSDNLLDVLGVPIDVAAADLVRIPKEGGAVVVANHPFGGLEGIALLSLLSSIRPDVRILANSLLHCIPQFREQFFFVDPFGRSESARTNIRGIKGAIGWVESGGLLVVFPAGEVSHLDISSGRVADLEWSPSIARIIRRAKVPAIPIYCAGQNGALFQLAGLVHPRLRTVMLPRELLNKRGMTLAMRIGSSIPFSRLGMFSGDREMIGYLRERTYLLEHRGMPEAPGRSGMSRPAQFTVPVQMPVAREALVREIDALAARQRLLSHGEFQVFYAGARQMPEVLREIGRLRELAFRAVGEGTGGAADLDRFDAYYDHLVLFDRGEQEIVGAYRIGRVDHIVKWFGRDALYTSTLFRYSDDFLRRLGPALELGRSFVQPRYQKSYNPLMLLWKGIGCYVARFPRYRRLFGPVSISDDYSSMSQRCIASFLQRHAYDADLGSLVRPRTPARLHAGARSLPALARLAVSLDDVGAVVGELEGDGRGVPVLLRQYLRLGGKLLGLNVDPAFNNVLDALVYVDLVGTERRMLDKYMGAKEAERFLRHHMHESCRDAVTA